jgi:hypothetical protein
MDLKGIIAISGRPGLFKVIAQGKNNVIVESLIDNKRFPAYTTDRISALEDISIYTTSEEKPLKEIFTSIFEKENGKETISHKDDPKKLEAYLAEILPDYDRERVYISDIKKIFQWFNLLLKSGNLKLEETAKKEEKSNDADQVDEKPKKPAAKKKAPAKKDSADKTKSEPKAKIEKKTTTKTAAAKKPVAKKNTAK